MVCFLPSGGRGISDHIRLHGGDPHLLHWILFCSPSISLSEVTSLQRFSYHHYTDDTQLLFFPPSAVCVSAWMSTWLAGILHVWKCISISCDRPGQHSDHTNIFINRSHSDTCMVLLSSQDWTTAFSHTTLLVCSLNWLSCSYLNKFKALVLAYKEKKTNEKTNKPTTVFVLIPCCHIFCEYRKSWREHNTQTSINFSTTQGVVWKKNNIYLHNINHRNNPGLMQTLLQSSFFIKAGMCFREHLTGCKLDSTGSVSSYLSAFSHKRLILVCLFVCFHFFEGKKSKTVTVYPRSVVAIWLEPTFPRLPETCPVLPHPHDAQRVFPR